mmetsp:Transcript_13199/g.30012  ORF Transcript_13199/g.30012 Transcript_13199/m.30012 type:complete len:175 (-) Transcript_13199:642-1166(-)
MFSTQKVDGLFNHNIAGTIVVLLRQKRWWQHFVHDGTRQKRSHHSLMVGRVNECSVVIVRICRVTCPSPQQKGNNVLVASTLTCASGTSVMRSSRLSSRLMNPSSMSFNDKGVGCKHVNKRLVSSRSRGPLSMAKEMAFLGISELYSWQPNSSKVRMTSSASHESKYSLSASKS